MSPTVLFFLWQLFGPNDPIVVSRETTYITAPLRHSGLPDYERYVLEHMRQDITPENNSAVLLWKALWPGELEPSQYRPMCDELGFVEVPSAADALQPSHSDRNRNRLRQWLGSRSTAGAEDVAVDALLGQAMNRPWTTAEIPPLAEWIRENHQALDLIVKATHRPRYYSPSPSLIDEERGSLIEVLLPGIQSVRAAARSLVIRAMWHLGENRPIEAWRDLMAIHRLARLVGQEWGLVGQMVSLSIATIAHDGTVAMLGRPDLSLEQSQSIRHDLASLKNFAEMASRLDSDRLMFLSSLIEMHRGVIAEGPRHLQLSADWNVALRSANQWHDRLAEAANLPKYVDRRNAVKQIEEEIRNIEESKAQDRRLILLLNRQARSEVLAAIFVSRMLPNAELTMNAQDQANTFLELSRLAAAIAVWQAEHGRYPDGLAQLIPNVVPKLPVDLYHARPFIYRCDSDGYLLYSIGANGIDDGGSNSEYAGGVLAGRYLDGNDNRAIQKLRRQIPAGADDISVRVPTPAFTLPKPPATQP